MKPYTCKFVNATEVFLSASDEIKSSFYNFDGHIPTWGTNAKSLVALPTFCEMVRESCESNDIDAEGFISSVIKENEKDVYVNLED